MTNLPPHLWTLQPSIRDNKYWLSLYFHFFTEDEIKILKSPPVMSPRNTWTSNDTEIYIEFSTLKQGKAFVARAKKQLELI